MSDHPPLYILGGPKPVIAKSIGAWGMDEASVERELEAAYARDLEREGETVRRQVRTEAGIADIVTDDAVIEVKLRLTRTALFSAAGQVTAYAICLKKPRRRVFGYFVPGTQALISSMEASGIDVITWPTPANTTEFLIDPPDPIEFCDDCGEELDDEGYCFTCHNEGA